MKFGFVMLVLVFVAVITSACSNSRTTAVNSNESEFIWEQYGDCKYYYKRTDDRVVAMFISCTLPYDRAAVADAMKDVLGHAYGEKVFSEPYNKDYKVCMTGREHIFCASPGGNGAGKVISLVIDRTSPFR
jgi:hypothetical protein